MAKAQDAVFLIPGFLGFERFEDFAYFGDRVGTALRAAFTQRFGRPVPVVAVPIPPTGSLQARQRALARTLSARTRELEGIHGGSIDRIHLIGHSTGGVDAQLLTLERSLAPSGAWDDVSEGFGSFRSRLRSVISIASPHHGTCLADDPLARLLASDSLLELVQRAKGAADEVAKALLALLKALPVLLRDDEARDLALNVIAAQDSLSFLRELRSRELIDDLSPGAAESRYAALGRPLRLHRRSFVTVAAITANAGQNASQAAIESQRNTGTGKGGGPQSAPFSPPDALFLLLSQLTSGRLSGCFETTALADAQDRIAAALRDPSRRIVSRHELLPQCIDAASNDGIVNAVRQLIDGRDPNELAGVIIADHFDVVGHYDKQFWVADPKSGEDKLMYESAGLLHSGSEFRDEQFFELMQRIVDAMAEAF